VINIEGKLIKEDEMPFFLSEKSKFEIINQNIFIAEAKVVYEEFQVDLFREESAGIKKLIEFMCPFINTIMKGKVLICDEIETSLHESLIYKLFDYFKQYKNKNDNYSQIISATHNTSLLDLNLLRRDQIWFIELKEINRSTDLYSLSEIKNVRKDENIEKGYISGKYGAIPLLNDKQHKLDVE